MVIGGANQFDMFPKDFLILKAIIYFTSVNND